ncbi:hypothetical protein Leryth_012939 [Lithospermum erythrorhizon]|nr:hypothetical protein Leryth_012939 [Lithospermum erythrorhizon]
MGDIQEDRENDALAGNLNAKDVSAKEENKVGKPPTAEQSSLDNLSNSRMSKGALKSFSHELGPKGGIQTSQPRAHSMNDLKMLLGSFRSRFDAAKEVVNTELNCFSQELKEILQNKDSLALEEHKMAEELLQLAHQCIEMSPFEFRKKCEAFVQELSGKRQQCLAGLLKWLLTRMLFILTRCTRLLHLEKDMEPVDETRLHKFQECLERLPFVETDWIINRGTSKYDSGSASPMKNNIVGKVQANTLGVQSRSDMPMGGSGVASGNSSVVLREKPSSQTTLASSKSNTNEFDQVFNGKLENKYPSEYSQDQEEHLDDSDLVICRICEESVPSMHLQPHSYICAYADKCDLKVLDVNERLWKMAELLEQLSESDNFRIHETYESPDNSKIHISNSAIASEDYSPRTSDWRSKGVEGMFEDLHEMDTACIEDFQMTNVLNFKGYLGAKLSLSGPPSSTGSMTSTSSTNTPRAGSFDFSWLDGNNPLELEDAKQIYDLADIARSVAGTDISEDGSHEFLLECMQDLQEVLMHCNVKALVVETFGYRIENLLREKYILACNLVDTRSDGKPPKGTRLMLNNASERRTMPAPRHPSHKEGTSIEDFEIIKPISRGAFGKVFLARKRATGDLFAIKVLKKLDFIRKNDIERILAERNILITVRNPFVVRFFYSFTSKENLYLVMEYLIGGDLYSLLRKVGCLEENVARVYIAELVLALEYIHSLGIVHRDIKPDNILIAQDGHIKLTDFGLSKIGLMNSTGDLSEPEPVAPSLLGGQKQHNTDTIYNHEQSAVGTPDYLAPEILLGTEHGTAADWWSVGIVLFELITGVPPFNAEYPEKIFDNILNRKIPWPAVPREISFEAQDLIDRFLCLESNHRLGARGSSEVKAHSFFKGIDWDNLAFLKAAFIPQPERADDTTYFVSRYDSDESLSEGDCTASETSELSGSGLETMDECGEIAEFSSSPLDLSLINFSFKNLSQLASINHDVLVQGGKSSSKCASPCRGPD